MKTIMKTLFVALAALLVPTVAFAAPVLLTDQSSFDNDVVIDFEEGPGPPPSSSEIDLSAYGVLYGAEALLYSTPSFFVNTNPGDWVAYSGAGGVNPDKSITLDFVDTVERVGFDIVIFSTNLNPEAHIEAFVDIEGDYVSLGSVSITAPVVFEDNFLGVADTGGIDRIVISTTSGTILRSFLVNDLRFDLAAVDTDNDGVLDGDDLCPNTLEGEIVDVAGCSISDLNECNGDWKNHGKYVSSVVHTAQAFVEAGLITQDEMDDIVSAAAQSDCGKK